MKYLVIAEKPSVARSISKVIGAYKHEDGYQTMKIEFNCEDVIRRALEKYGA